MKAVCNDGNNARVLIFVIAAMLCVGCGMPQPIQRPPIMYPVPQPISYPIPQPISNPAPQPNPLPISYPTPQPTPQPSSGVFSLAGSATQQSTVKTALSRCDFPFERLKPGLRQAGLNNIKIFWQSMGEGSLGWASTGGEVAISDSISGLQAQRTVILEVGHAVDFFYMTPEMRKEIVRLWHPDASDNHDWFGSTRYWDQNGEAFSALFLWAFSDEELLFDAGYSHKPSRELAAKVRAILLQGTATNSRL
ncbi:MAG: hypothetical protein U0996_21175 [Planctomycetaceae bacterium]|jgi:hypothetical protein